MIFFLYLLRSQITPFSWNPKILFFYVNLWKNQFWLILKKIIRQTSWSLKDFTFKEKNLNIAIFVNSKCLTAISSIKTKIFKTLFLNIYTGLGFSFSLHKNLTHLFPMQLFCTPWKHQKTLRFSNSFRG